MGKNLIYELLIKLSKFAKTFSNFVKTFVKILIYHSKKKCA